MSNRIISLLLAGTLLSLPAAALAQSDGNTTQTNEQAQGDTTDNSAGIQPQTIAETVSGHAGFQFLAKLIDAADLTETLSGGEYTVFAPSDMAFGALPTEVLVALLKEENKEVLKSVLLAHVVEGSKPGGAFIDKSTEVSTVSGDTLTVEGNGELVLRVPAAPGLGRQGDKIVSDAREIEASVPLVSITIADGMIVPAPPAAGAQPVDKAYVSLPDITVTNGVVHAVNAVIVPKSAMDALGIASQ